MNRFDRRVIRDTNLGWIKGMMAEPSLSERDLLSFRGAEFEFETCPAYVRSITQAAARGFYGFNVMSDSYREAVLWWMREVRKTPMEASWIVPTQGTIFSLATTMRLATKPGEGILMLTPGYSRYEQAARRLGRTTKMVPMKEECGTYAIDFEALEEAFTDETYPLFAFCNPNNPTGVIYGKQDLVKIAQLAEKYHKTVFCDEIFADVTLRGETVPIYAAIAGDKAKAVSCTGMGKLFSLTGVNHANCLIANPAFREDFRRQRDADHYGSLDPLVAAGMIGSFNEEGKAWLNELENYVYENYIKIRDFMEANLSEAVVYAPQAGYTLWIDYAALNLSKDELHELLCVQGGFDGDEGEEYFGRETCYRYCLALPAPDVEKALNTLEKALSEWKNKKVTE